MLKSISNKQILNYTIRNKAKWLDSTTILTMQINSEYTEELSGSFKLEENIKREKKWWWGMDSNHRRRSQQIYSLPPLAAREPHQQEIQH